MASFDLAAYFAARVLVGAPTPGQATAWVYLKDLPPAEARAHATAALARIFREHLAALLLKLFDDPTESCRTNAMDLFSKYAFDSVAFRVGFECKFGN